MTEQATPLVMTSSKDFLNWRIKLGGVQSVVGHLKRLLKQDAHVCLRAAAEEPSQGWDSKPESEVHRLEWKATQHPTPVIRSWRWSAACE